MTVDTVNSDSAPVNDSGAVSKERDCIEQSAIGPGARVIDRAALPDIEAMRVLTVDVGTTAEDQIADGMAVADYDGNEPFPADDPVVEVVFEDSLEKMVSGWPTMVGESLPDELAAFEDKWGVSVQTYYFPRSRVRVFPERDDIGKESGAGDGRQTAGSEQGEKGGLTDATSE
jgi:hypothetical protein